MALWAFAALGTEAIYAFLLEPFLYGAEMESWTDWQNILHWTITCISWSVAAWIIIKMAEKKQNVLLLAQRSSIQLWRFAVVGIILAIKVAESMLVSGELKFIHECKELGVILFLFQHLYYLCETLLFTLIIIFGQKAFEKWFHNDKIPYGGIVTAFTWGIGHFLSKDFATGIFSTVIGFCFGAVYLILNRNVRWTVVVLFLLFII